MLHRFALSHHKHTGRILPHRHTSYFPLFLLLAFVGFMLSVFTVTAAPPGPESSSIGITGVMPGKPPMTAPTIDTPNNNQRFTTTPITVKGSCPPGTLVEVFKNDIFAGSAFCGDDGKYTFDIDLLFGRNVLIARVYDALNQASPDSQPVIVFYDSQLAQPSGLAGLDFGGAQLLINTDAVYRGVFPNKEMAVPMTILGGKAPYAVNVQWGDNEQSLIPRGNNAVFNATHTYKKPGTYPISVKASDADGRVAFITVAAVVNGQPDIVAAGTTDNGASPNILVSLWPVYVATVAIVLSFWLGEVREKRVLQKRGQLVHQY